MLEELAGQSWEQLIDQRLFKPLGMYSAFVGMPYQKDKSQPSRHYHRDVNGNSVPLPISERKIPEMFNPAGTVSAKDVNGKLFTTDCHKRKFILLCFWAIGCKHCSEDYPVLRELDVKYNEDDLLILGINVNDKKEAVIKYQKENNINWRQILDKVDNNSKIQTKYKAEALPTYVLIDRNGKIVGYKLSKVPNISI